MSIIVKEDCLNGVVGLSRTDCDCFDVPDNTSLSNLWLDELDGLNLRAIDSAADCEKGSLGDIMQRAMEQSIMALKADLPAYILKNYKVSRQPFAGLIGKEKKTSNATINNFAALKILCAPIKSGIFKIKRIGAAFAGTGTIELNIYNNIDSDPLYTVTLNAVTDKLEYTAPDGFPIALPMYSDEVSYLQYFFVYANPSFAPKNNKLGCCGFHPSFSSSNPLFKPQGDVRYRWHQYVNASGVTGITLASVTADTFSCNETTYGLLLDAELKCNIMDAVCYDLDFENSEVSMVLAHALRYKAGASLIQQILSSNRVNAYTLTSNERLMGTRNTYIKEYNTRLQWLADNMDLARTGCIECDNKMKKGSIL